MSTISRSLMGVALASLTVVAFLHIRGDSETGVVREDGLAPDGDDHLLDARPEGSAPLRDLPSASREMASDARRGSQVESESPRVAEAGEAPAGSSPPDLFDVSGTASDWEREYAPLGWRELREQSDEIMGYIKEQARDELKRMLEGGEYEVISNSGSVNGLTSGPDRLITGLDLVRIMHDGEVQRYQVSKEQFPDLYALADKAQWMEMQSYLKEHRH